MKILYKVLVIGMICLLSNNTYAQIYQYSDDGKNASIKSDGGGSERQCFCLGPIQLGLFTQSYSGALLDVTVDPRDWLGQQELLLAGAMDNKDYYTDALLGQLPANYNFTASFRNYIMRKDTRKHSEEYPPKLMQEFPKISQFNGTTFERARDGIKVLEIRAEEGVSANPSYGDLSLDGVKLKDMSNDLIQYYWTSFSVLFADQKVKYRKNRQLEDKLKIAIENDYIVNFLTDKYIDFIGILDYENVIHYVTRYMAAINGRHRQTMLTQFGSPNNIYDLRLQDLTNELLGAMDREILSTATIPVPQLLSSEQALYGFAYHTELTDVARGIFPRYSSPLKESVRRYFQNRGYKEGGFQNMNQLAQAIKDKKPYRGNGGNYTSTTNAAIFQNSTDKELGLSWMAENTNGVHFFKGLGGILKEFYGNNSNYFSEEGGHFRGMFNDNGVSLPNSFTNTMLGQLFNFRDTPWQPKPNPQNGYTISHSVQFGFVNSYGSLMWENGLRIPELFSSSVAIQAVNALLDNNIAQFEHLARVYTLSKKLTLNAKQEEWLTKNFGRTSRIDQYLQLNQSQEALETMRTLITLENESNYLINPDQDRNIVRTVTYYNDGVFDSDINFCGCSMSNEFVRDGYLKGTISEQQLFDTYGATVDFQIQNPDGTFRPVSQLDFYLETAEIREGVVREILAWTPVGDISEAGYELYDGNFGMAAANIALLFVPFDRVVISGGKIVKVVFRNGDKIVEFTVDQIWKMKPFTRGRLIEEALAKTRYKDYLWTVDIPTANGKPNYFWPYFDFIKGNKVVSVKTTTATRGFGNIIKNIKDLRLYVKGNATNGGTIINDVDLDIWVPAGYDKSLLDGVIDFGRLNEIKVNIKVYE